MKDIQEFYKKIKETVAEIQAKLDSDYKIKEGEFLFFVDLDNVEEFSKLLYHDCENIYNSVLREDYLVIEIDEDDLFIQLDLDLELHEELMNMLDKEYRFKSY